MRARLSMLLLLLLTAKQAVTRQMKQPSYHQLQGLLFLTLSHNSFKSLYMQRISLIYF